MLSSIPGQPQRGSGALLSLLNSFAPLNSAEREIVRDGVQNPRAHPAGSDIPAGSGVMLSGWAGWIHDLADARRQIVTLLLPGDLVQPGRSGSLAMTNTALTDVTTADVSNLLRAIEEEAEAANLRRAWHAAQAAVNARVVAQVTRLGRQSAYERTAHLLVELMDRQRRGGLASLSSMPLPVTQETLADVLGLSIVHLNRTLQTMRRDGLIQSRSSQVIILDEARLRDIPGLG